MTHSHQSRDLSIDYASSSSFARNHRTWGCEPAKMEMWLLTVPALPYAFTEIRALSAAAYHSDNRADCSSSLSSCHTANSLHLIPPLRCLAILRTHHNHHQETDGPAAALRPSTSVHTYMQARGHARPLFPWHAIPSVRLRAAPLPSLHPSAHAYTGKAVCLR